MRARLGVATGIGMLLVAGAVAGCGGDDDLADRPDEPLEITVERRVVYSNDEATPGGWMDVFHPVDPGPWPVVLFLHGAADPAISMEAGSDPHTSRGCPPDCKSFYDAHLTYLAQQGTIAILAGTEYRANTHLGQVVEDLACIGPFLAARAADYGGDPEHTVVVGHSRGATLGAALAFGGFSATPGPLCVEQGDPRPEAIGFVGLSGDYEMMGTESQREPGKIAFPSLGSTFDPDEDLRGMGITAQEAFEACSPYAHLDADPFPPAALFSGTNDLGSEPEMADRLVEAIRDAGGEATTAWYEGEHHESIHFPSEEAYLAWERSLEDQGVEPPPVEPPSAGSAANIAATLDMAFGEYQTE